MNETQDTNSYWNHFSWSLLPFASHCTHIHVHPICRLQALGCEKPELKDILWDKQLQALLRKQTLALLIKDVSGPVWSMLSLPMGSQLKTCSLLMRWVDVQHDSPMNHLTQGFWSFSPLARVVDHKNDHINTSYHAFLCNVIVLLLLLNGEFHFSICYIWAWLFDFIWPETSENVTHGETYKVLAYWYLFSIVALRTLTPFMQKTSSPPREVVWGQVCTQKALLSQPRSELPDNPQAWEIINPSCFKSLSVGQFVRQQKS